MPPWHLPETHLLLLAHTAPFATARLGLRRAGGVVRAVGRGPAEPTLGVLEAVATVALAGQALAVRRAGGSGPRRQTHTGASGCATAVSAPALRAGRARRGAAVRDHADAVVAKPCRALRIRRARPNSRPTRRTRRATGSGTGVDAGRGSWGERRLQHRGCPQRRAHDGAALEKGTTSQPPRMRRRGFVEGTPGPGRLSSPRDRGSAMIISVTSRRLGQSVEPVPHPWIFRASAADP